MSRNKTIRKRQPKKVCSIIVEGKTEKWYFQKMKDFEKLPKINIYPELNKKKKLEEQYKFVKEKANYYDKVIWILDFDVLIKEERERKKTSISLIEKFNEYRKKLSKYDNVFVLVITPCLEFWFLLHFKETRKYYSSCKSVVKEIKKNKLLKDYEKSEKYFKKRDNNIYQKLKFCQNFARKNAKSLGEFESGNYKSAKAEIYKLFDLLEIE